MVESADPIGGGSHPDQTLPGIALRLALKDGLNRVSTRLRQGDCPIVSVIRDGAIHLHVRTVLPGQEDALVQGIVAALPPGNGVA